MASRELSRTMILDPVNWPLFPFLPMKSIRKLEVGFLFADDVREGRFKIFCGPIKNDVWRNKKPMEGCFAKTFDSLNALLDDGWVVD